MLISVVYRNRTFYLWVLNRDVFTIINIPQHNAPPSHEIDNIQKIDLFTQSKVAKWVKKKTRQIFNDLRILFKFYLWYMLRGGLLSYFTLQLPYYHKSSLLACAVHAMFTSTWKVPGFKPSLTSLVHALECIAIISHLFNQADSREDFISSVNKRKISHLHQRNCARHNLWKHDIVSANTLEWICNEKEQ